MTGIEFLSRAVERLPEAKRVLLTAYADTDAAIRAINEVKLNYYLIKRRITAANTSGSPEQADWRRGSLSASGQVKASSKRARTRLYY